MWEKTDVVCEVVKHEVCPLNKLLLPNAKTACEYYVNGNMQLTISVLHEVSEQTVRSIEPACLQYAVLQYFPPDSKYYINKVSD